jgi:hypothetical protein
MWPEEPWINDFGNFGFHYYSQTWAHDFVRAMKIFLFHIRVLNVGILQDHVRAWLLSFVIAAQPSNARVVAFELSRLSVPRESSNKTTAI